MKPSRNRVLRAITVGCTLVAVTAACTLVRPDMGARQQSATPSLPTNQQEGAPYPADEEHLSSILSLSPAKSLPNGAHVDSVTPAVNFAKGYRGGWGYVIAFTASDESIRAYVTEHTGLPGKIIENYSTASQNLDGLEDIDLSKISNPWETGFGNTTLLLERPLGRGWLVIRGAPR